MVSLINKLSYLKELEDKPKIKSFIELLNDKVDVVVTESTNDTDKLYFEMIRAISNNSKKEFSVAYNDFTRRMPSVESPWLNNDFLLFVIILGVGKFSLGNQWINNALCLRKSNNQEFQSINQTLINLLSGNLNSTDNNNEIIIVYQHILNLPQLSKELLDKAYLKLSSQVDLFDKHNDFMAVISLRAFDVIITTKETPDATEVTNLKSFRQIFIKRINLISDVIYGVILTVIVIVIFKYYKESIDFKGFINDLGAIFSILGIAVVAAIKYIRMGVKLMLLHLFGYKKYFKN